MTFQEYLETLTTSQCHQLIVEAYSHMGGISLARALLNESGNDPDPQITSLGAYVLSVGVYLYRRRISAADPTLASQQLKVLKQLL